MAKLQYENNVVFSKGFYSLQTCCRNLERRDDDKSKIKYEGWKHFDKLKVCLRTISAKIPRLTNLLEAKLFELISIRNFYYCDYINLSSPLNRSNKSMAFYYMYIVPNAVLSPHCSFPYFFMPQVYENSGNFSNTGDNSLIPHPEQRIEVSNAPRETDQIKSQKRDFDFAEDEIKKKEQNQYRVEPLPFIDKHNIIPNNINHIFAFIQRKSKSQKIIQKIIQSRLNREGRFTARGFYSYQTYRKNRLSIHVNIRALETVLTHVDPGCSVFTQEEQLFYNLVCRVAVRYYLTQIAPLVTLNSRRLKNTNKKDHLMVQRYLSEAIYSKTKNNRQNIGQEFKHQNQRA